MTRSFLLLTIVLFPLAARADLTPPNEDACLIKRAGAACTFNGKSGTCQTSTCSRLDYQNRTDAGLPGVAVYDCLKCIGAGTAGDAGPGPESANDAGTSAPGNDTAGGCSTAALKTSRSELAALIVASTFSLLFLVNRRRRRS